MILERLRLAVTLFTFCGTINAGEEVKWFTKVDSSFLSKDPGDNCPLDLNPIIKDVQYSKGDRLTEGIWMRVECHMLQPNEMRIANVNNEGDTHLSTRNLNSFAEKPKDQIIKFLSWMEASGSTESNQTIVIPSHGLTNGITVYFKEGIDSNRYRLWRVHCEGQIGDIYDDHMYFDSPLEYSKKTIFTIEGSNFYQDYLVFEGKLLPIAPSRSKESSFLIGQDFLPDEAITMNTKLLRKLISLGHNQEGQTFLGKADGAVVKVLKTRPEIGGFYLEYQGKAAGEQIERISKFNILHAFERSPGYKRFICIKDSDGKALPNLPLVAKKDLNHYIGSTLILQNPLNYEEFCGKIQTLWPVMFVKTKDGFEFLASDSDSDTCDFIVEYKGSQTLNLNRIAFECNFQNAEFKLKDKDSTKKGSALTEADGICISVDGIEYGKEEFRKIAFRYQNGKRLYYKRLTQKPTEEIVEYKGN